MSLTEVELISIPSSVFALFLKIPSTSVFLSAPVIDARLRFLCTFKDNLVRINDILSTYEERIEPLRIEREKALEFNELSDELRKKEVSLIVHTIKIMEQELKVFNEELNKRVNQINEKRLCLRNNEIFIQYLFFCNFVFYIKIEIILNS